MFSTRNVDGTRGAHDRIPMFTGMHPGSREIDLDWTILKSELYLGSI